jgi:hypothetical protein
MMTKTMMTDLRVSSVAMGLALTMIFGAARFVPDQQACAECGEEVAPAMVDAAPPAELVDCDTVLPPALG